MYLVSSLVFCFAPRRLLYGYYLTGVDCEVLAGICVLLCFSGSSSDSAFFRCFFLFLFFYPLLALTTAVACLMDFALRSIDL